MTTNNPYNAEFFERYLNDEVTQEERQKFDEQLVSDSELLDYFTLYMDVDLAIDQPEVMNLRDNLQNIYDSNSSEWLEEAPMIVENSFEEEVDNAISELDVMALRSTLNDLHDLHSDELHSTENAPVHVPIPAEKVELSVMQEIGSQDVSSLEAEIEKAIMEDDVMSLRSQLDKIGEEYVPVKKTISLRKRFSKAYSIAAAVLIMILGGTAWIGSELAPMSSERAVKIFMDPIEAKGVTRGGGDTDQYLRDAFRQYREADYAGAASFFDAYEKDGGEMRPEQKAYAGVSKLFENKSAEALKYFTEIIEHGDNTYVQKAQWYSVMCRLRNDEVDLAISQLRQLAVIPDHEYIKEINKLLTKLE